MRTAVLNQRHREASRSEPALRDPPGSALRAEGPSSPRPLPVTFREPPDGLSSPSSSSPRGAERVPQPGPPQVVFAGGGDAAGGAAAIGAAPRAGDAAALPGPPRRHRPRFSHWAVQTLLGSRAPPPRRAAPPRPQRAPSPWRREAHRAPFGALGRGSVRRRVRRLGNKTTPTAHAARRTPSSGHYSAVLSAERLEQIDKKSTKAAAVPRTFVHSSASKQN